MLGKRYINDGIPPKKLSKVSLAMKEQVDKKVMDHHYKFEDVPCAVCEKNNFETLSEKGRHGEYVSVVICKVCGLIQTNPRMDQSSYNEFYNVEYRKMYGCGEKPTDLFLHGQGLRGRSIFRFLESRGFLPDPQGSYVLEVGCASGGILKYFCGRGCKVKGIDLGRVFLEFGRSHYGLDLEVNTIFDVQLEKRPDLIIYSHVFEHVLDVNKELERISEIIAPGGVLYIEVPGFRNPFYGTIDFLSLVHNSHTYHFTLTTLKNLLIKNGFELVAGNEKIKAAFKFMGVRRGFYVNDYIVSMRYWKFCEFIRKVIPDPSTVFSRVVSKVRLLTQFLGIYEVVRKIYLKVRYRGKILE